MPRNWLEWGALGAGLAALLVIVGVLTADAVSGGDRPPTPRVELHTEQAYETDNGWLLPATMTNDGDRAAEALVLVAVASVAGEEERSEVAVDYAPPGSEVEVTFGFSAPPDGDVEVIVTGFRLP
jgi:uncharacterized protein (TIGR02588 family)